MAGIAWFKELNKENIGIAGGKGASLGEMFNAGFPIPPGFVVTAQAYKQFLKEAGIAEKIYGVLKNLDVEDNEALQEASKKVQKVIMGAAMPEQLKEEIAEAYDAMSIDKASLQKAKKEVLTLLKATQEPCFVAVRSSATAEDLPQASFAGQQATYLNVKGPNQLLNSVQKCWASLFTARAVYYRIKNNFPHEKVLIAVVVQKMVSSAKSGVIFSVNPVSQKENEILLEAGWGLGEAVVSGAINPDEYIYDKGSGKIIGKRINEQTWMYTRDVHVGTTVKKDVPPDRRKAQILTDYEIKKLANLAMEIENHYKKPQDIEYAIEGQEIYIVQSRPITTLKAKPTSKKEEEKGISLSQAKVLVEGLSASPGIASGAVKIVHGPEELSKIKVGDVLVAEMTNPDYVAGMQRAAAIVTDSGGSTCFSGETKVLTTEGFVTMKDACGKLSGGEKLKVLSLNPKTLKSEWKVAKNPIRRKAKTWEVTVSQKGYSKQNKLRLTPDHKMFSLANREVVEEKLNNLIANNNKVCVADFIPSNLNPHEINNPRLAYVCGATFSDGYIEVNNRRGRVVFTQKETEAKEPFINEVKNAYYDTFGVGFTNQYLKKSAVMIRGKVVESEATDFASSRKLPASKLKSIRNNIGDWVLHLGEESLKKFIAGSLDGDGTFNIPHESGRLHIYTGCRHFAEGLVLAFLRMGILPQVSVQGGSCYNIQVTEKIGELLAHTKRVKGDVKEKLLGTKLLSAKQIVGDIIDEVNLGGKIKPYVKNSLLIDAKKVKKRILPLVKSKEIRGQLLKIIDADFRMQRAARTGTEKTEHVYNFEVEDNHTYTVFTENYTPVIAWNCHAAIVSREMGVPCIVGSQTATKTLREEQVVTVDATAGKVYEGKVEMRAPVEEGLVRGAEKLAGAPVETVTEIKVIMDLPEYAEKAAATGADGVGLLRAEFMILGKKEHPNYLLEHNRREEYVQNLVNGMKKIADSFRGKPVWYRTLDAPTDEFRHLKGGEEEPEEDNPMMGWRSIRRSLDQPELIKAEFDAIKRVHDAGYTNIGIMLPLVTHVDQIRQAKKILREMGLEPLENIDFGVMIETPAAVQIIKEICEEGIDFISFGTNDLTQFTLAVDRNSAKVQKWYDEMHPGVLRQIAYVIKVCKEYGVETSICGQAGSKPEMAEFLVRAGIDSISANPDAVQKIRHTVARAERKLLLKVARKDLEF